MKIEYLNEVVENPVLNNFKNRPLNEAQITSLEKAHNDGKAFPKAFREFLYLAGDFNNFAFDDLGEGLEELQNIAKEEMTASGQEVKRPFFAFDVYDSQYSAIFLDENEPDPKVYLISPFLAKEKSEPLVKPNGWIFSKLVNESLRRVKYNIAF
jgi:hypothetical protein